MLGLQLIQVSKRGPVIIAAVEKRLYIIQVIAQYMCH